MKKTFYVLENKCAPKKVQRKWHMPRKGITQELYKS